MTIPDLTPIRVSQAINSIDIGHKRAGKLLKKAFYQNYNNHNHITLSQILHLMAKHYEIFDGIEFDYKFFNDFFKLVIKNLYKFTIREKTNILWSSAYLKIETKYIPEIFQIFNSLKIFICNFNGQDACNCLYAFTQFCIKDVEFISKLVERIKQIYLTLENIQIATIILSLANLNYRDEELIIILLKLINNNFYIFESIQVANILFALAVFNIRHEEIIFKCIDYFRENEIKILKQKIQLIHALIFFNINPKVININKEKVFKEMESTYKEIFIVNDFEKEIALLLDAAQIKYQQQVFISGYCADFLINNIVLECDGDIYHLRDSQMRDKILKEQGYDVVHILASEINQADDQLEFILKKLTPFYKLSC